MADLPHIRITTDGACKGNPGPGGWAAILQWNGTEKLLTGAERQTTNNRMEMTAALKALEAMKRPAEIILVTDSKYLLEGITKWIHGWKRNGWRNASREPVKNADLWQALDAATRPHSIQWQWVKGHSGDPMNERADALANQAIASMLESREG
ncbi:ribonuclease HI [Sandaracinobacter neustonicus]|uniref:Ribonuclease H n=1 Tax=Sandaracinobacter neustonicus TaxID=1715348 RepID=A0A501XTJ0_9SPHN|nr:ribonuclease HI [Sandaracinobacter neustonicus]TPE63968.1 ribonuclease HI [Sandaracinobacter neustonicus]